MLTVVSMTVFFARPGEEERLRDRLPCVYILASGRHGTLYIGVTSDLLARLHQHREGITKGFTARYAVHRLVYYEMHGEMDAAITREKQLKNWRRDWKIELIERDNPFWEDLAVNLGFETLPKPKKSSSP